MNDDPPPPIGLFTDPHTGLRMVIRMGDNGKPHVIPYNHPADEVAHILDPSCDCGPDVYRPCTNPIHDDGEYDLSRLPMLRCPDCDNRGSIIATNPLFSSHLDQYYVHHAVAPLPLGSQADADHDHDNPGRR